MRYNGLRLVIEMALNTLDDPLLHKHADALVLGAIREDITFAARRKKIREHWSLSHFDGAWLAGGFLPFVTPSAPTMAQRYFDRALDAWRRQRPALAFVELGKASHLLIDMACPVHASRVAHLTDGYEWYVETHGAELARLPLPLIDGPASAAAITAALARHTRRFAPDRTNHHWGRLLKRLGLRRAQTRAQWAAQADAIIPVAAAHLAQMYRCFLSQTQAPLPCS